MWVFEDTESEIIHKNDIYVKHRVPGIILFLEESRLMWFQDTSIRLST